MKKIDWLVQQFENLNTEEQSVIVGGFVTAPFEDDKKEIEEDLNYFQCGCNNACDFSEKDIEGLLTPGGTITWNALHEKRLHASPLNTEACIKCSILPICAGGCSQRLIEHSHPTACPLGMNDNQKKKYAYRVLSEKLERTQFFSPA